jgi:rare lipoprotein A
MTAAHKTLPFGTILLVTNTRNNRSCLVRINDRGPYIPGRMLDLSAAAARVLNIDGVGSVRVDILER